MSISAIRNTYVLKPLSLQQNRPQPSPVFSVSFKSKLQPDTFQCNSMDLNTPDDSNLPIDKENIIERAIIMLKLKLKKKNCNSEEPKKEETTKPDKKPKKINCI